MMQLILSLFVVMSLKNERNNNFKALIDKKLLPNNLMTEERGH
jgi:hypothetical protein